MLLSVLRYSWANFSFAPDSSHFSRNLRRISYTKTWLQRHKHRSHCDDIYSIIFCFFVFNCQTYQWKNDCFCCCSYAFNLCNYWTSSNGIVKLGNSNFSRVIDTFRRSMFATAGHYTMTLAFAQRQFQLPSQLLSFN